MTAITGERGGLPLPWPKLSGAGTCSKFMYHVMSTLAPVLLFWVVIGACIATCLEDRKWFIEDQNEAKREMVENPDKVTPREKDAEPTTPEYLKSFAFYDRDISQYLYSTKKWSQYPLYFVSLLLVLMLVCRHANV